MPTYNLSATGANSGHIDHLVGVSYTKSTADPASCYESNTGGEEPTLIQAKYPFAFIENTIPSNETAVSFTLGFPSVGTRGGSALAALAPGSVSPSSGAQAIYDQIGIDFSPNGISIVDAASQSFTQADWPDLLTKINQAIVSSDAYFGIGIIAFTPSGADYAIADPWSLTIITTAPTTQLTTLGSRMGGMRCGRIGGRIS